MMKFNKCIHLSNMQSKDSITPTEHNIETNNDLKRPFHLAKLMSKPGTKWVGQLYKAPTSLIPSSLIDCTPRQADEHMIILLSVQICWAIIPICNSQSNCLVWFACVMKLP